MHNKVLVCGNDRLLLQTREAVLRLAEFDVACVEGVKDLYQTLERDHPDLLILCFSLKSEDKKDVVGLARERSPETKILAIAGASGGSNPDGCYELGVLAGPNALVEKTAQLLS